MLILSVELVFCFPLTSPHQVFSFSLRKCSLCKSVHSLHLSCLSIASFLHFGNTSSIYIFLFLFCIAHFHSNMPATPTITKKSTRSNSVPSGNIPSDFEVLINRAKEDIIKQINPQILKVLNALDSLSAKIDHVEMRLSDLTERTNKHEERMCLVETSLRNLEKKHELHNEGNVDVGEVAEEAYQRSLRVGNLIISGVSEPSEGRLEERQQQDAVFCRELLRTLDPNIEPKEVVRIGRGGSVKPRLIKVICNSAKDKFNILRRSKELRSHPKFVNVFLSELAINRHKTKGLARRFKKATRKR